MKTFSPGRVESLLGAQSADVNGALSAHKPDFKAYLLSGPKVDDFRYYGANATKRRGRQRYWQRHIKAA